MEVHAHAHHAPGRKKWTHYFWEFLMLFLAIFCGFLAEYQLEHMIERDREIQYMQSMVEDLQRDTANINSLYEFGNRQKEISDSIVTIVNNQSIAGDNIEKLYLLHANSSRVVNMNFEARTSLQLKNAGGMRLIRKRSASDSILNYWAAIEKCNLNSYRLDYNIENRNTIAVQIFHNKYYIEDGTPFGISGIVTGAKFINDNPSLLAEYSNRTYSRKKILAVYLRNLETTKQIAVRLIEHIRVVYSL